MISTMRPAPRRSTTSRRSKSSIWGIEMPRTSALLFAIVLASTGSARAVPVTRFVPDSVSRAINTVDRPDESRVILGTARRTRGRGRAGCWWPWWRRGEPQRQLQQQQLPSRRGEQQQPQDKRQCEQPKCERQREPQCERQRQSERECLRRRWRWLLLWRQLLLWT